MSCVAFSKPRSARVQPATRLDSKVSALQEPVKVEMMPDGQAAEARWIRRERRRDAWICFGMVDGIALG